MKCQETATNYTSDGQVQTTYTCNRDHEELGDPQDGERITHGGPLTHSRPTITVEWTTEVKKDDP